MVVDVSVLLSRLQGIEDKLLVRTKSGRLFARELHGSRPDNKMDHLVCFLPGACTLHVAVLMYPQKGTHAHSYPQCPSVVALLPTCLL